MNEAECHRAEATLEILRALYVQNALEENVRDFVQGLHIVRVFVRRVKSSFRETEHHKVLTLHTCDTNVW